MLEKPKHSSHMLQHNPTLHVIPAKAGIHHADIATVTEEVESSAAR